MNKGNIKIKNKYFFGIFFIRLISEEKPMKLILKYKYTIIDLIIP